MATRYLVIATIMPEGKHKEPVVSCHKQLYKAKQFVRKHVMAEAKKAKVDSKEWLSKTDNNLDLVKDEPSVGPAAVFEVDAESKFRISIDTLEFPEESENDTTFSMVISRGTSSDIEWTDIVQVSHGPESSTTCVRAALFYRALQLSYYGHVEELFGRVSSFKSDASRLSSCDEWPRKGYKHPYDESIMMCLHFKDADLLSFLNQMTDDVSSHGESRRVQFLPIDCKVKR